MADSFTEKSSKSYGKRIGESFKGIASGGLLFLVGIGLLVFNEKNSVEVSKSLKEGENCVISVSSETVDPANDQKLVHFTGRAVAESLLADEEFGVAVTNELRLIRSVEMYQWTEEVREETEEKIGGREETTRTYTYKKTWSPDLIDSSSFAHPEGHDNPADFLFGEKEVLADEVFVGAFRIPPNQARYIGSPIDLPAELHPAAGLPTNIVKTAHGWYLPGARNGTAQDPQIGDERVVFRHVPPCDVSFIAQQIGSTIAAYPTKTKALFIHENGIHSSAEMFSNQRKANSMLTWLLRLLGFILISGGVKMILAPLVVLASVLPFLGRIVGFGTGFVAFLVGLIVSLLTIAISWLAYRPLIGIPLLVAVVALIVFLVRKVKAAKIADA